MIGFDKKSGGKGALSCAPESRDAETVGKGILVVPPRHERRTICTSVSRATMDYKSVSSK